MTEIETDYVREHYNTQIPEKYSDHYEFNRWFKNKRTWMDYYMTYLSIVHHLSDIAFNSCFELGPGPGTWTRLLYRTNPLAQFTLLDISSEMKKQFNLEMRNCSNVTYNTGNFMEYKGGDSSYDLFFSSRAFEYLPNKEEAVRKIGGLLNPNGTCIIITKSPDKLNLRRNKHATLHKAQISAHKLSELFKKQGFCSVQIFPVIVWLPIIDRATLKISKGIFERTYKKRIEKSPFYAESYIIVCRK